MSECKTCGGRGQVQTGYAGEELADCPDCTPCGECGGTGGVDSGGFTPWGAPIDIPCPSCEENRRRELCTIGAAWKKDSSLEKWFPMTAEELAKLKDKVDRTKRGLSELQKWAKYFDIDPIARQAIFTAIQILGE